jgi:hypothetical protein
MFDRQAYRSFAIVAVVAVEGEVALALGVIVTVLLGGGLMTVVFLSDRTGQDR